MNLQKQEGIKMAEPKMWQPEGHTWEPNEWQAQNKQPEAEDDIYAEEAVPDKELYFHAPRSVLAGTMALGRRIANTPHHIAKGLEGLGQGIGESFNRQFPNQPNPAPMKQSYADMVPHLDEKRNYAQMLGQHGQGTLADRLVQGLIEHGPELALAGRGAQFIGKGIAKLPLTPKMAARPLNWAETAIGERGIKLNIPNSLYKDVELFIPKNSSYKELLKNAKKGDYKAQFTIQSDLRKIGDTLKKSSSGAERLHGIEAHKLRQNFLNAMHNSANKQGQNDISEAIIKGQKDYRTHYKYRKPITAAATAGIGVLGLKKGYDLLNKLIP
jgi:hypothetical protein